MANVLYGMENTHKISLNSIIQHSISVRKGTKQSLLVVDMPKGSYKNPFQAKKNARPIPVPNISPAGVVPYSSSMV